jgi:hypothetical protein
MRSRTAFPALALAGAISLGAIAPVTANAAESATPNSSVTASQKRLDLLLYPVDSKGGFGGLFDKGTTGFSVDVAKAGTYYLQMQISYPEGDSCITISIDGQAITPVELPAAPGTYGRMRRSETFQLSSGTHSIVFGTPKFGGWKGSGNADRQQVAAARCSRILAPPVAIYRGSQSSRTLRSWSANRCGPPRMGRSATDGTFGRPTRKKNGTSPTHADPSNVSTVRPVGSRRCTSAGSNRQWMKVSWSHQCTIAARVTGVRQVGP